MHADTVETLVQKAKFAPDVAVGVAEAMDVAMNRAEFVTVPVFKAELASLEGRIDKRLAAIETKIDVGLANVKAELVRWVLLVMLGNVALGAGATAIVNYLQRVH